MKFTVICLFLLVGFWSAGQVDSVSKTQELEEVSVSLRPQKFYRKKNHFILDILALDSGMLVLTKSQKQYALEVVAWGGVVLGTFDLEKGVFGLDSDCLGNTYLVVEDAYERIQVSTKELYVDESFSVEDYEKNYVPCLWAGKNDLVFLYEFGLHHGVHLWRYDVEEDESFDMFSFLDSVGFKDLAQQQMEISGSVGANIARMGGVNSEQLGELFALQSKIAFVDLLLTPAARSVGVKDSLCFYFFNAVNDSMYFFEDDWSLSKRVHLNFMSGPRDKKELLYDAARGKFYLVNVSKGLLLDVDGFTGEIVREIDSIGAKAPHKFVRNGRLYFVDKRSKDSSFNQVFIQML